MSGAADFFNPMVALNPFSKDNPFGKATNPFSSVFGIRYGRAEDDPEHWKRKAEAEKQRSEQALAAQRRRYEKELARPENVRARAEATSATLGESGKRLSPSQYLAG